VLPERITTGVLALIEHLAAGAQDPRLRHHCIWLWSLRVRPSPSCTQLPEN
jgi:hypothetical protein